MAVVTVKVYDREVEKIMHMTKVTSALHTQAEKIAARGRSLTGSGGISNSIFVQDGVRPRGRTYSRAVSDFPYTARSYNKTQRRVLLARAADIT